ncbi:MAG: helix-turn-helix domain-containing protein [Rhodoferax sp.]|nr:helix-turn-helix domain-containing protein [Rhodoferax sp.]
MVLLAAKGVQNKDIAVEAGLDRRQVALWRQRFLNGGIDALRKDAPRTGRPATVTAEMESRIVQATSMKSRSTPPTGAPARWLSTWAWVRRPSAGSGKATA